MSYKDTLHCWVCTRVKGGSASMCCGDGDIDLELLKALDETIKPILDKRKEYNERYREPHPEQKFMPNDIVRITNPRSWFAKDRKGQTFKVEYTYYQMFGGDTKNYSLYSIDEEYSSAWYHEDELELVKMSETHI